MNVPVARAVKDSEYVAQKQWLSGYVIGHERKDVWRVELRFGHNNYFVSTRKYGTEALARAAASRINKSS